MPLKFSQNAAVAMAAIRKKFEAIKSFSELESLYLDAKKHFKGMAVDFPKMKTALIAYEKECDKLYANKLKEPEIKSEHSDTINQAALAKDQERRDKRLSRFGNKKVLDKAMVEENKKQFAEVKHIVYEMYEKSKKFSDNMSHFYKQINMAIDYKDHPLSDKEKDRLRDMLAKFKSLQDNPLKSTSSNLSDRLSEISSVYNDASKLDARGKSITEATLVMNDINKFFNEMLSSNREWAEHATVMLSDRFKDFLGNNFNAEAAYKEFMSYTVQPMQQLPRAELLLRDISIKGSNLLNSKECDFAEEALGKVKKTTTTFNASLASKHHKDPNNDLINLMRSLLTEVAKIHSDGNLNQKAAAQAAASNLKLISYDCTENEKLKKMGQIIQCLHGLNGKNQEKLLSVIAGSTFCPGDTKSEKKKACAVIQGIVIQEARKNTYPADKYSQNKDDFSSSKSKSTGNLRDENPSLKEESSNSFRRK